MQTKLPLDQTLQTESLALDIEPYNTAGELIQNTGVTKLGGVTNLSTKEDTLASAYNAVTPSGKVLTLEGTGLYRTVKVDGVGIGTVSAYGVQTRYDIEGAIDACICVNNSQVYSISVSGGTITLRELNLVSGAVQSRNIVFTNLTDILPKADSISIVRSAAMGFNNQFEFLVRFGEVGTFISEANLSVTINQFIQGWDVCKDGSAWNAITYRGWLVVYGSGIASWDGTAWRYADGSGAGSGIYMTSTELGFTAYTALVWNDGSFTKLILAGSGGNVKTVDGLGVQVTSTGTAMGSSTIWCAKQFGTRLFFAGNNGRVCSCDSSGVFTNYNSAGAGTTDPSNNNTVTGGVAIYAMEIYSTFLVFGGDLGRIGHWTGSAWVNYNAAGTGSTILANNGTVIGTNIIWAMTTFNISGSKLFVAGDGGRVGHWNGTGWVNYNAAGTGVSILANNGTVVGTNRIVSIVSFGGNLYFCGLGGRIGRIDSATSWRNYDSGLPYSGNLQYGIGYTYFVPYTNQSGFSWIVAIGQKYLNSMNGDGVLNSQYNGDYGSAIFSGETTSGQIYVWKYQNGQYLIQPVGSTRQRATGDPNQPFATGVALFINGAVITPQRGRYALLQYKSGRERHVLNFDYYVSVNNLRAYGIYGYINFDATFSTATNEPIVQNLLQTTGAVKQFSTGLGYNDIAADGTSNDYTYLFPSPFDQAEYGRSIKSNTNTLVGGYAKLTNAPGAPLPDPANWNIELRIGTIGGIQSYLSAAIWEPGQVDAVGVLLTAPGEYDATFQPEVNLASSSDRILYRFDGVYRAITLGFPAQPFQQITDTLTQINTVTPNNVYDDSKGALVVSNIDYNGRMIFESNVAPALTSTPVASKYYTNISNGIDTGVKLVQIANVSASNITVPGVRLPLVALSAQGYAIDTYISDLYAFSTLGNLSELALEDKKDTLYLTDTTLPLPIGMEYQDGAAQYAGKTIFLDENRNTYSIGNDLQGTYDAFRLFGQLYLADQYDIYLAEIAQGVFSRLIQTAPKNGLEYIAVSPNEAYFLSSFDNSLYTFSGGRSLVKAKKFTTKPAITLGAWSDYENTLYLNTATSLMMVRDGIVSEIDKPASIDGTPTFYDTSSGVYIVLSDKAVRYRFNPFAGSSIVPLTLQTGYYGIDDNMLSKNMAYVVTLYAFTPGTMSVTLTLRSFDQEEAYTQQEVITLTGADFNAEGYTRLRMIPQQQLSLGASLEVSTSARVVILDVAVTYEPVGPAAIVKSV